MVWIHATKSSQAWGKFFVLCKMESPTVLDGSISNVVLSQLPPPSLSSYIPWKRKDNPYGPPQPAAGGVVGWFNDQVRKFKNRNNRSAAGAYEPSHGGNGGAGGRRGFGPLDPDEAWDARVGNEADSYGYYEEELGGRGGHGDTEYSGAGSYGMNLAATPGAHDEEMGLDDRGRRGDSRNPFDDSHEDSLRGVSPRPMGEGAGAGRPTSSGSSERRSVFKENV